MKIAVIGAGFAGLALAFYLKEYKNCQITIFHKDLIGQGASGASSGLMHPFSGEKCRKAPMADLGMQSSLELLRQVEQASHTSIFKAGGIIRPATDEMQEHFYKLRAEEHQEIVWQNAAKTLELLPQVKTIGSLFIASGITVYAEAYIQALYTLLLDFGVTFKHKPIHHSQELALFDQIVIATGSSTLDLEEFSHLPLRRNKGQILELSWPKSLKPLDYSIVGHIYITKGHSERSCFVGATYERGDLSEECNLDSAKNLLMPKAIALINELDNEQIVSIKCGFRTSSIDNIWPIAGKIKDRNQWIFTGLGSKGLLHHAWIAKALANAIMQNNQTLLPKQLYHRLL